MAEARNLTEHRDRRCGRSGAAGVGMGGGHQLDRPQRAAAVPDHIRLDSAALLGARHCPAGGVCARGYSDAPGNPRRGIHPLANTALHRAARRGHIDAIPDRHERPVVSCGRPGSERRISVLRAGDEADRAAGIADAGFQVLGQLPDVAVRRVAGRSLSALALTPGPGSRPAPALTRPCASGRPARMTDGDR